MKQIFVELSIETDDGGEHKTSIPIWTENNNLKVSNVDWYVREVKMDDQGRTLPDEGQPE